MPKAKRLFAIPRISGSKQSLIRLTETGMDAAIKKENTMRGISTSTKLCTNGQANVIKVYTIFVMKRIHFLLNLSAKYPIDSPNTELINVITVPTTIA